MCLRTGQDESWKIKVKSRIRCAEGTGQDERRKIKVKMCWRHGSG